MDTIPVCPQLGNRQRDTAPGGLCQIKYMICHQYWRLADRRDASDGPLVQVLTDRRQQPLIQTADAAAFPALPLVGHAGGHREPAGA